MASANHISSTAGSAGVDPVRESVGKVLLNEPLAHKRRGTQFELMNLQDELGIHAIVVEAEGDKLYTIAVMNAGRCVQIGTPTDIYEFPESRQVAISLTTSPCFRSPGGGRQ